jgi:SAM-dependent methyltransferase
MGFNVSGDAYGRFMGRFSEPLAPLFADAVGVRAGQRALDVGCGPGALTAVLVDRLGADAVSAVDPSESFVAAAGERLPGVDVRAASAEELPFEDGTFDVVAAQLVVHFMTDPLGGLREMARVARHGGTVGACVWDHGGGTGPLEPFWETVHSLDPLDHGEATLAGAHEGHLVELFGEVGLRSVQGGALTVRIDFPTFGEWWEPFTLGVGPAGTYVSQLDDQGREALREACEHRLGPGPFEISATAWVATGVAPGSRT